MNVESFIGLRITKVLNISLPQGQFRNPNVNRVLSDFIQADAAPTYRFVRRLRLAGTVRMSSHGPLHCGVVSGLVRGCMS